MNVSHKKAIRFILYRYLILSWIDKKNARQGSLVSILIPVFGVAIGVFAFLVVLSVMSGFAQNIKNNMLQFEPHIIVKSLKNGFDFQNNDNLNSYLQHFNSQIIESIPVQLSDVIIRSKNKAVIANLQGVPLEPNTYTSQLERYLNYGTQMQDLGRNEKSNSIINSKLFPTVILGADLISQLNVNIGDSVTLISPNADDGFGGFAPIQMPVVVIGELNSGHFAFDKKMILSSLKTSNLFLQTDNAASQLNIILKNPMLSNEISVKLNNYFNQNKEQFISIPWTISNQAFLKALTIEHYGMTFVLVMIILVACFSITISLLLSIRKKSKEMAILRSLGMKQLDISLIYMWQGFLIGFAGVCIGLTFGFLMLYFIHNYSIPLLTSNYSAEPLPILIQLHDVLLIVLSSLILSILAALWPAYEVKKLNIIEILSLRN